MGANVLTTAELAARLGLGRRQTIRYLRRHSIRPVGRAVTGRRGHPAKLYHEYDAEWLAARIGAK